MMYKIDPSASEAVHNLQPPRLEELCPLSLGLVAGLGLEEGLDGRRTDREPVLVVPILSFPVARGYNSHQGHRAWIPWRRRSEPTSLFCYARFTNP
jgi:hypothetical protein